MSENLCFSDIFRGYSKQINGLWFIYDCELRHEIVKLFSELYFGVNGSKQCYVNKKYNKYSEHQSRKYAPPRQLKQTSNHSFLMQYSMAHSAFLDSNVGSD